MLTVGDLAGRRGDRLGLLGGQHAELAVGDGGRRLHVAHGVDQPRLDRGAADREVLDRALGLGPPQRVRGHPDLAHAVVLDPELVLAHTTTLPRQVPEQLVLRPARRRASSARPAPGAAPRGRGPRRRRTPARIPASRSGASSADHTTSAPPGRSTARAEASAAGSYSAALPVVHQVAGPLSTSSSTRSYVAGRASASATAMSATTTVDPLVGQQCRSVRDRAVAHPVDQRLLDLDDRDDARPGSRRAPRAS